ncbi:PREDICTED: AT-hook motif nuclear-localized protein 8-like [Ipomoea nil]|uniref:AT-hook motif nuclear-localized protein 8-like n=1 Tax=Ipomoea nil TaxID=35883 RepID=UPI00090108BB|nr:PREDICTED: AT-hook motif nuclear-localized protein 8-like [Ipomoea nil]
MDSQDSQLPLPHHHHHHHHPPTLHHPQPQFHHHHHQQNHHQQQPGGPTMMVAPPQQPNSYASMPNNVSAHNSAMMHHQQHQQHHHQQQQSQQNPRFPFNSMMGAGSGPGPAPKPAAAATMDYSDGSSPGASGFSIEPAKKKRGRPRKYSPDGNIALGLSPTPVTPISSSMVAHPDSAAAGAGSSAAATPSSENQVKKARGRPPGSVKKQMDALGSAGVGFTPHVITVEPGEDVALKIMEFSQQGPRTVCILSAIGAICNVTLRQPSTGGGTVTLEGQFEIISLSGSFLFSESDGHRMPSGLSVSLAGADGKVVGGGVAGTLKAASQVQLIVGSFIADGKKPKYKPSSTPLPQAQSNMLNFSAQAAEAASPSEDASSASSDDNGGGTPLNRGPPTYGNANQPVPTMQMYANMGWPNSTVKMHHP